MSEKTPEELARENALVEGASKLYPVLELECEGRRAVCVGGHEDDIDSINVSVGSEVILISEWVLERCLRLPGGTTNNPVEDRQLTLTKPFVVAYGNQHVHKTPLLQWCRDMCKANGVQDLAPGTPLLVFWWDMEHSKQDKTHKRGHTWWPSVYVPQYDMYGIWFSARVVEYDKKRATLQIVYDYNDPEELELGKVILPLNFVHFGRTPPPLGGVAQVFPPPWKPPALMQSQPLLHGCVMQCPKESLVQQGKPASLHQKQQVELVVKQHRPQLQSQHLQVAASVNSQPRQQQQQQQQEPSDVPALMSLPPQPQQGTSADVCGQLRLPPILPPAASQHQQQKCGGQLPGSKPKLKTEAAGVQDINTDEPTLEAGPRFSSAAASPAAPVHPSALPLSYMPPNEVLTKKPGASNGARTGPSTSNKRGKWVLDDELEGDSTGLGTTYQSVKRHKDGGGQRSQAILAGQQPQLQLKQQKPQSAAMDSSLGSQQQQTHNILGLPPRPSSLPAAAAVGTSRGASVGVVHDTDTKHRHTRSQEMVKQQQSRPASTTGSGGVDPQGVHVVPATASTPAAAEVTPAAVVSAKASNKAAASSGTTASGLRAPKLSSLQRTASPDSKQVVQGSKQRKHHSPSLMKVAHQAAPNQQPSRSQSQPLQEQQQPEPSRQRQQQSKQKTKQQSNTVQHSASLDVAEAATANETAASNPLNPVKATDCQAAVCAAVGVVKVPELPVTTGALAAGSALPHVDLAVGPTSRVAWPGNKRRMGGAAPKADDLVLRLATVQHCALLSDAHVKAIAVAKGLLLGGSSDSAADILQRHLPQGELNRQSSPLHPSPPPSSVATGSTSVGITMQQPGSLERPFQRPKQQPIETARGLAPGIAGTVAGPAGQPAVAPVAITMAGAVSAGPETLTAVSGGVVAQAAAAVLPGPGMSPDDGDSGMAPADETGDAIVLTSARTAAATKPGSLAMDVFAEVAAPVAVPVAAGVEGAVVKPVTSVACRHACSAPGGCVAASAGAAPTLAGCLASLRDAMTHLSSVAGFISNPSPSLVSHHQQQPQVGSAGHNSQQQPLAPRTGGKCVATANTTAAIGGGSSDSAAFGSTAGAVAAGVAARCGAATSAAAVTQSPRERQQTPPSPPSSDDGSDSDGEFAFVDNRQYVVALPPEARLAAYEALVPDRRAACPTPSARPSPALPLGPADRLLDLS